jgi:HEAT repeat protein
MNIKTVSVTIICLLTAGICFAGPTKSDNLNIIRAGLKDESREIRELSARSLGMVGDRNSVKNIKELLVSDQSDSVKIAASVSLVKLGDKAGLAELRKILSTVPKISETPKPVERVRAMAKNTIRAQAARELGDLKDSESLALLKKTAADDDGRVADASLIALAKMGESGIEKRFISALASTNQDVRAKAAEALGDINNPAAIEPLRKRLTDWDKDAKCAAVIALGKLKDKQSVPVIREMLWDKDDGIKEKAAISLGYMGDTSVAPAIKELLKDKNGFVRFSAVEALNRLGQDSGKDFIIETLKAQESEAKLRALNILEKIVTAKDIAAVEPLVSDADKSVSITAARVIVTARTRENK